MGGDVCLSNAKNANPSGRGIVLTPDDLRRMVELYAEGLTCQKIADLFGCSNSTVSKTLRKLGVKMRPVASMGRIPKEKHPQIIQLYKAGQTCKEIAKEFGCLSTCIYKILRKHDVKMRPPNSPGKYSEDICRKMVDLYKQGHTSKSIVARFGCCTKTLNRIFDEYDIERRLTLFQPRYTAQDHQRMASMYEQGKSLLEIAEEIGCVPTTVNRILNEQGIETPPIPPRRFITQAEREMIVNLYQQGKSHSEIATKIGCVPQTIGKILRKLNIPIRVQGPDAYCADDQQKMADLYENGMSLGQIAVGFDCGTGTVIQILRKHGIKIRPLGFKSQVPPKKREKMLTLYKEGYSGDEIAAKFGCGLETVFSVIELATRKSQIVQRITTMPSSNAADKTIENNEPPLELPPQIPLDTLVRNFWADKARAVDALLLPPDLRLIITESVEQALAYAWKALGQR